MPTRLLLEHGADANMKRTDGSSSSVTIEDWQGNTPLHVSAHEGFCNISQLLIESSCNFNVSNTDGKSPLHIAIEKNDETLVKLLLKNNADVNIQDISRDIPLHVSARRGFFKISQMLIDS